MLSVLSKRSDHQNYGISYTESERRHPPIPVMDAITRKFLCICIKIFNWPAFAFHFEFKPRFDEIFHILQEPNETHTGLNRLAGIMNEKRYSFL